MNRIFKDIINKVKNCNIFDSVIVKNKKNIFDYKIKIFNFILNTFFIVFSMVVALPVEAAITWGDNLTGDRAVYSLGFDSSNGRLYYRSVAKDYTNYITIPALKGYTLPAATSSALGGVKIGSNITVSSGTISLTKANITSALGYTPPTSDTNTTYSAATSSALGLVKIGSNITNSSGTISLTKANVTAALGYTPPTTDTNTTYSAATSSAAGLMSAADKSKLDGIASGANAYTLPVATASALGGIKVGSNITNSSGTISLTKDNVTAALGYTPPTADTNTTYAAMSTDELTTGTATTSRAMTAKVLSDFVKNQVATETTARTTALSSEVSTRSSADTALSNRIGTLSTNGNYITTNNTALDNISVLDSQLKQSNAVIASHTSDIENINNIMLKYDSSLKEKATFSGSQGTVLANLKGGAITADSMEAINGSQLYTVKQSIDGFATDISRHSESIRTLNNSVTSALSSVAASGLLVDTMDVSKADSSLTNLTDTGKNVLKTYAADAVQEYMASHAVSAPMAPVNTSITNYNTLRVTDAGNGSLHVGEGSYVNGTSSIAIGVGNQVNANNSGAFGDPSIINADESYVLGNDDTISTGATGSFIVGNDGVSDAKGGLLFGSNTKVSVGADDGLALGNRTEVAARNAIALGSDSVADVENVLSVGNSNLQRKIINVADGEIVEGSHEVITGGQLFMTNEKVQQNADAILKKADVDATNIVVSDWATKLGVGKIEDGNTDLVTGGAVYSALKESTGLIKESNGVISIGSNSEATQVDISGADGTGRVLTGIVTDETDMSSATNVGFVNQVSKNIVNQVNRAFQHVDTKINKVGANAAAIASVPTPAFDGEEKWAFGVGIGHYQGETAGAIGAFYRPTDNVIARVGGSFGNGDEMVGAGVSVSLNKGDTPVVSKAQLVRTINAQAQRINAQDNEIQGLKAGREADKAEIASVRAENLNMQQALLRLQERLDALENK